MGRVVRQASGTERARSNCRLGAKSRADRTAIFTETYFSLNKYRHRLKIVFHLKPVTVMEKRGTGNARFRNGFDLERTVVGFERVISVLTGWTAD